MRGADARHMRISKLGAATLAASLTLGGAAMAFADDVMPEDPTIEDVVETTTTTAADTTSSTSVTTSTSVAMDEADEPEDGDGGREPGTHPDNHGAAVSQAAHDTPPGPGHGKAVSEVARSNHGHTKTQPSTKAPKQP